MSQKSYFEKLKDPRWQKIRLKVMESAGFACEICGDTENTLNIHHTYYEPNLNPWEYPINSLKCLCENCHKQRTMFNKKFKEHLNIISRIGFSKKLRLAGYMVGIYLEYDPVKKCSLFSRELAAGVGDYFNIGENAVLSLTSDNMITGKDISRFIRETQKQSRLPWAMDVFKTYADE